MRFFCMFLRHLRVYLHPCPCLRVHSHLLLCYGPRIGLPQRLRLHVSLFVSISYLSPFLSTSALRSACKSTSASASATASASAYKYTHASAYTSASMSVSACAYLWLCVSLCICICVRICIHIYHPSPHSQRPFGIIDLGNNKLPINKNRTQGEKSNVPSRPLGTIDFGRD